MGFLFERVRRNHRLEKPRTTSPVSAPNALLKTSPKHYNRHQKLLLQLLTTSSNHSNNTPNLTITLPSSWNQEALIQLVRQRPALCRSVYDFSITPVHNNNINKNNNSASNNQQSRQDGSNWFLQYPLWRLFQMPTMPSLQLLYTVHRAHPAAMFQTDLQGNTILHSLCSNTRAIRTDIKGLLSSICYIIGVAPELLKAKTITFGATPLHVAVRYGSCLEVVQLLVDADPTDLFTTTTISGETPLHWACQNAQLSFVGVVVPYLLQQQQKNCDGGVLNDNNAILAINRQGETALHLILHHHRQQVASSSFEAVSSSTVSSSRRLRSTARLIAVVQALLQRDPSRTLMSIQDSMGRVPLHLALSFGSFPLPMIKFLVQQKPATLCARDVNGFTPVHQACLYPAQLDILRYLVRGKITLNASRKKIKTSSSTLLQKNQNVFDGLGEGGLPTTLDNSNKKQCQTNNNTNNRKKEAEKYDDGDDDDDDDSTKYTISVTSASSSRSPPSPSASLSTVSSAAAAKSAFLIKSSGTRPSEVVQSTPPLDLDCLSNSNMEDNEDDDIVSAMMGALDDDDQNQSFYAPTVTTSSSTRQGDNEADDDDDENTLLQSLFLRLPNRSGALPLHVACEFWTSLEVVRTLVKEDPQSLRQVDRQGCTPLHLACASRAPYEILQYLIQQYAEALYMEDNLGRLPLHVALEMMLGRHFSPPKGIVELLLGRHALFKEEVKDDDDSSISSSHRRRRRRRRTGSLRMATTRQGETAYDIALRHRAPAHILAMLALPRHVTANAAIAASSGNKKENSCSQEQHRDVVVVVQEDEENQHDPYSYHPRQQKQKQQHLPIQPATTTEPLPTVHLQAPDVTERIVSISRAVEDHRHDDDDNNHKDWISDQTSSGPDLEDLYDRFEI